jgi:hypothetical protein
MKITKVYKYLPPRHYLLDTVKNNLVYLSYPSEFNDPFDCRFNINYDGDLNLWINWLNKQNINFEEKEYIRSILLSPEFNPNEFIKQTAKHQKSTLVSCFTTCFDNILMWGHYAENHKGICLGYKVEYENKANCIHFNDENIEPFHTSITNGAVPLYKVSYVDEEIEPLNFFDKQKEIIIKYLTTKSTSWEYEDEWRLLYMAPKVKNQLLRLRRETLQDVYFGFKIDPDLKNDLIEILKNDYLNQGYLINLYQEQLGDKTNSIIFNKINI